MTTITREQVEDFLYEEAKLLDAWQLDDWLALWTPRGEIAYRVEPTGEKDRDNLNPDNVLFLIADDRFRLEQRMIRMKKPTAHAEYLRSLTRHLYANVRIIRQTKTELDIEFNFATYRTQRGKTAVYPGRIRMSLKKTNDNLKIKSKIIALDLEHLSQPGTLTILL